MNTEQNVNNRRNWKAETFPYDYYTVEPGTECQYCLTDKQVEVLLGIVEPLAWATRWFSDTQDIDKQVVREFRDDITRRLMMSCCGDEIPIIFRFTSDGDLEKSTDGGETWLPAPENDPRNNSPQFPPLPSEDPDDAKCIAATGMVALMRDQINDQLTDDMSRYTLGQLITDWVHTLLNDGGNILDGLITIIQNQTVALGIAALRAALTDPVYANLLCIFFCGISDDGSFDDGAVAAVESDISDQIGGVAGVFINHLVDLLGATGLTNLARAGGAAAGDCSDCPDCTCAAQLGFETSGFSTVISVDEDTCTFVLESVPDVAHPGQQIIGFDFGMGCGVVEITESSGANQFPSWFPCGGSGEITHGLYGTQSVNYLYLQNTDGTVFQATFVITAP
ncbi:MAG TPA: hypothetical protein VGO47_06950 [Chlamydiales bacterium]|jgi:hypothetical protein|nr:hypothetical protein [Chlamydiales bacterium]